MRTRHRRSRHARRSQARRSTGVSRALLRAAEAIAQESQIETVKIAVMSGNARAQDFYEAHRVFGRRACSVSAPQRPLMQRCGPSGDWVLRLDRGHQAVRRSFARGVSRATPPRRSASSRPVPAAFGALLDERLCKAPEAGPRPANLRARLERFHAPCLSRCRSIAGSQSCRGSRRSEAARRAAKTEEERPQALLADAQRSLGGVSGSLLGAIQATARVAVLMQQSGPAWRLRLNEAELSVYRPESDVDHGELEPDHTLRVWRRPPRARRRSRAARRARASRRSAALARRRERRARRRAATARRSRVRTVPITKRSGDVRSGSAGLAMSATQM